MDQDKNKVTIPDLLSEGNQAAGRQPAYSSALLSQDGNLLYKAQA